MTQPSPSLTAALLSLRTSTSLLSSTISFLDASTADLPRLGHVLSQRRHFELLPSSTLRAAQEGVVAELGPEVEGLLARAEEEVERLERREGGLRARWALLEGRLGREVGEEGKRGAVVERLAGGVGVGGGARVLAGREEVKAQQLRQKKERLSYAVERLTLQAGQAERKLRMSMAAQEMRQGRDDDEDELA